MLIHLNGKLDIEPPQIGGDEEGLQGETVKDHVNNESPISSASSISSSSSSSSSATTNYSALNATSCQYTCVDISENFLIFGSNSGHIVIFQNYTEDTTSALKVQWHRTLDPPVDDSTNVKITQVKMNESEDILACGDIFGNVLIYLGLSSHQNLMLHKVSPSYHTSFITALCFSSSGCRLISGCEGGIAVETQLDLIFDDSDTNINILKKNEPIGYIHRKRSSDRNSATIGHFKEVSNKTLGVLSKVVGGVVEGVDRFITEIYEEKLPISELIGESMNVPIVRIQLSESANLGGGIWYLMIVYETKCNFYEIDGYKRVLLSTHTIEPQIKKGMTRSIMGGCFMETFISAERHNGNIIYDYKNEVRDSDIKLFYTEEKNCHSPINKKDIKPSNKNEVVNVAESDIQFRKSIISVNKSEANSQLALNNLGETTKTSVTLNSSHDFDADGSSQCTEESPRSETMWTKRQGRNVNTKNNKRKDQEGQNLNEYRLYKEENNTCSVFEVLLSRPSGILWRVNVSSPITMKQVDKLASTRGYEWYPKASMTQVLQPVQTKRSYGEEKQNEKDINERHIEFRNEEEYLSDLAKNTPQIKGKLWPIRLNNNKEEECIGVLLSAQDGLYLLKTDRPHKNMCLKNNNSQTYFSSTRKIYPDEIHELSVYCHGENSISLLILPKTYPKGIFLRLNFSFEEESLHIESQGEEDPVSSFGLKKRNLELIEHLEFVEFSDCLNVSSDPDIEGNDTPRTDGSTTDIEESISKSVNRKGEEVSNSSQHEYVDSVDNRKEDERHTVLEQSNKEYLVLDVDNLPENNIDLHSNEQYDDALVSKFVPLYSDCTTISSVDPWASDQEQLDEINRPGIDSQVNDAANFVQRNDAAENNSEENQREGGGFKNASIGRESEIEKENIILPGFDVHTLHKRFQEYQDINRIKLLSDPDTGKVTAIHSLSRKFENKRKLSSARNYSKISVLEHSNQFVSVSITDVEKQSQKTLQVFPIVLGEAKYELHLAAELLSKIQFSLHYQGLIVERISAPKSKLSDVKVGDILTVIDGCFLQGMEQRKVEVLFSLLYDKSDSNEIYYTNDFDDCFRGMLIALYENKDVRLLFNCVGQERNIQASATLDYNDALGVIKEQEELENSVSSNSLSSLLTKDSGSPRSMIYGSREDHLHNEKENYRSNKELQELQYHNKNERNEKANFFSVVNNNHGFK